MRAFVGVVRAVGEGVRVLFDESVGVLYEWVVEGVVGGGGVCDV